MKVAVPAASFHADVVDRQAGHRSLSVMVPVPVTPPITSGTVSLTSFSVNVDRRQGHREAGDAGRNDEVAAHQRDAVAEARLP